MSINKHPTHKGAWQIRFYPKGKKGKQTVVPFKGTYEEALQAEIQLRQQHGITNVHSRSYITEIIPHYINNYRLSHLDTDKVSKHLKKWVEFLGPIQINQITTKHIERYKQKRIAEVKPNTINKELSALSGLLKYAKKLHYCGDVEIERFPDKMTKPPLPDVPTREEVLALIEGMLWPKCGLFACLYYAGLRSDEARHLRVENIFLDRECMIVRGKGNKQRIVPIVDNLKPFIVKRLSEISSGLMWPTNKGKPITKLSTIIDNARERIGMERKINPHLLRHAFGVHATMQGVGMRALQNAMGHSSVTTTEIYTQLATENILHEVRKFGKL
jgi:site-specific recombinase XerD